MLSETPAPLVLVVEDHEDSRALYAEYLGQLGYRVETAADGEVGLMMARQLLPAVIVMDLSLPVLDGCEAIRQLKNDERTRHICIVVVSGHAEARYIEEARAAGCDAFLSKPCGPDDLADEMARCLAPKDSTT